jgi:hypothetical protein
MIGKFEFIGYNGSMGFLTGKTYPLDITTITNMDGEKILLRYHSNEMGGSAMVRCPYNSWVAFFKNWKPIV